MNPGKWKHGRFNLRSNSCFSFEPHPYHASNEAPPSFTRGSPRGLCSQLLAVSASSACERCESFGGSGEPRFRGAGEQQTGQRKEQHQHPQWLANNPKTAMRSFHRPFASHWGVPAVAHVFLGAFMTLEFRCGAQKWLLVDLGAKKPPGLCKAPAPIPHMLPWLFLKLRFSLAKTWK